MARKQQFHTGLSMNSALKSLVESFIEKERLPAGYLETAERWFLPLLEELLVKISVHQGTYIIGISGSQGSGKSTLGSLLVELMSHALGLRGITLSIDDFYLTHAERQHLAKTIHPLLATRGVPGTHDVQLALDTISALSGEGPAAIPRFDKAIDDRVPQEQWEQVMAPVDVIILEGWCLCIGPQEDGELVEPVNELEKEDDSDGIWRRYVNEAIRDQYLDLYNRVDYLIMLKAPNFEKVYEWRQTQEDKLAEKVAGEKTDNGVKENNRIMSPEQLRRFIQHYERVTRHGLDSLPSAADTVFQLTDTQTIAGRI